MNTEAIYAAALQYKTNRENQGDEWDKDTDSQNLFRVMIKQGLTGCNSCAGLFVGKKPDGELFIVNIDEEITIGTYKNFSEFLRKCNSSPADKIN